MNGLFYPLTWRFGRSIIISAGKENDMYYFAYGTNINLKNFGDWCESRKIRHIRILSKQPAILRDFKLFFDYYSPEYKCGTANVHPVPGESLHGVLFNIPEEDFWVVKKRNGVPGMCEEYDDPVTVYLYDKSTVQRVKIFHVPEERCRPDLKPTAEYLQIMIQGARAENFHSSYISKLESIATLEL